MLFSLFFTMFSRKFQSTDTSSKVSSLASMKDVKSIGKTLSSVIGVNSAQAGVSGTRNDDGSWYCAPN